MKPLTVDAYIACSRPETQLLLRALRAAIVSAAPRAEEVISYSIPTYKHEGTLVHFMARNNRFSFITTSYPVIRKFRDRLKEHTISGTTIHFSPSNPLDAKLVKEIVKARLMENKSDGKTRGLSTSRFRNEGIT